MARDIVDGAVIHVNGPYCVAQAQALLTCAPHLAGGPGHCGCGPGEGVAQRAAPSHLLPQELHRPGVHATHRLRRACCCLCRLKGCVYTCLPAGRYLRQTWTWCAGRGARTAMSRWVSLNLVSTPTLRVRAAINKKCSAAKLVAAGASFINSIGCWYASLAAGMLLLAV